MATEPKYCQNSEYNKRLLKVSDDYVALLKIQLQDRLSKMKAGAWNIIKASDNPKLKKICQELDKLEIK